MKIRVLSLFDGISVGMLALKKSGIRCGKILCIRNKNKGYEMQL